MTKLAFLLAVVWAVAAINFPLFSGTERCFLVKGGEQYHVEYVVSGKNENATHFRAIEGQKVLFQQLNASDYQQTLDIPEGNIQFCWKTTDKTTKTVSVDFFLTKDPIRTLVTKHHIAEVEEVIVRAADGLATVSRNQLYQIERDSVHKSLLEQTESTIGWTGLVKILVLVLSAAVQIWVMRGFFKSSGLTYTEVAS